MPPAASGIATAAAGPQLVVLVPRANTPRSDSPQLFRSVFLAVPCLQEAASMYDEVPATDAIANRVETRAGGASAVWRAIAGVAS